MMRGRDEIYDDICEANPILAQRFLECIEHAESGWEADIEERTGEAFSNSIRKNTCCSEIENSSSLESSLRNEAMAYINSFRPKD